MELAYQQIPEMYYLPELLMDINNVDFGTKNDGTPLRGVALPPWAQNDPYLFVQLHRDALGKPFFFIFIFIFIVLLFTNELFVFVKNLIMCLNILTNGLT